MVREGPQQSRCQRSRRRACCLIHVFWCPSLLFDGLVCVLNRANCHFESGRVKRFFGKSCSKRFEKTLLTKQALRKWYPAEHTPDKCDLCNLNQQCETVAHFALACPVSSDSTTGAHYKVRKRFSNTLEKGLGKEMENWDFCWETQVADAFPVLRGRVDGVMWA